MSTLCTAWVVERTDNLRLGFTDHDGELLVDGVACLPGSGFTASAAETQLGFAFDNGALQGALRDRRITADDIAAGLYGGARVEVWRVDWRTGSATLLRTLMIGEITRHTDGRFEMETVGLGALLEEVTGRVVTRLCSAVFGDRRCGLDAADFPEGTACARSFAACRAFGNTHNYRGFPHLIGDDALVQGVSDTLPRDGGSRYGDGPDV